MGPAGTYTVATSDGHRSFAGLMQMPEDVPDHVPNYWKIYLGSEDVDADADCKRVQELGGAIVAEPFSIPGVKRGGSCADRGERAGHRWR
jgi:predicted enzyme related to lactoylglutathione lyase